MTYFIAMPDSNLLIKTWMTTPWNTLDVANVTCWDARPKRTTRTPARTYWEEYVETDTWYLKKLVEDVPDDEIHAACYDEDLQGDEEMGESDDESEELSIEGTEEDDDYIPVELSDECGELSESTDEVESDADEDSSDPDEPDDGSDPEA